MYLYLRFGSIYRRSVLSPYSLSSTGHRPSIRTIRHSTVIHEIEVDVALSA
jgi:hypothetical protein